MCSIQALAGRRSERMTGGTRSGAYASALGIKIIRIDKFADLW
jgi:hypothetical protein